MRIKSFRINPVLNKELRLRMRGWKATITLSVYLAILALVATFIMLSAFGSPYNSYLDRDNAMMSYIVLTTMQFFLIAFISPALTSGSISGERERQTLDLLLCTEMSPKSIIAGKLWASLSTIILLITASLPILSIVFIFGGISVFELFQVFLFYIVFAITLGSIGLFFSTHLKKTTASNVVTYAVVLFLMFGTIFVVAFYYSFITRSNPNTNVPGLLYVNPFTGFISLLAEQFGERGNIFLGIGHKIGGKFSLWQINIIVNLVMAVILNVLSAYKLNPVRGKNPLKFRNLKNKKDKTHNIKNNAVNEVVIDSDNHNEDTERSTAVMEEDEVNKEELPLIYDETLIEDEDGNEED